MFWGQEKSTEARDISIFEHIKVLPKKWIIKRIMSKKIGKIYSLSCVRFYATPWTVACQALLFMEFSRPEYWSRCPFPSPGDLPDQGIERRSTYTVGRFFAI